jgi:hypothetical protein
MSLNGLDTPELTEAFAKACAEPGSWYVNCFFFFNIYLSQPWLDNGQSLYGGEKCSSVEPVYSSFADRYCAHFVGFGLNTPPETMLSFCVRESMERRRCEKQQRRSQMIRRCMDLFDSGDEIS